MNRIDSLAAPLAVARANGKISTPRAGHAMAHHLTRGVWRKGERISAWIAISSEFLAGFIE